MILHPVTNTLYASCDGEGIFHINGNVSTVVVGPVTCSTAVSFAEGTISEGFLLARCYDNGLMRINLTTLHVDILLTSSACPGSMMGILYFSENGHEYVVVGCDSPQLLRLDLTDGSTLPINDGPDQCNWVSSIVRESDTGILWTSCYTTGGVARVHGTNITAVITQAECDGAHHLRYDPRTGVRYVACQYSGAIALLDGQVTTVVKVSQCSAFFTAGIDGAILVGCLAEGLLRVPSGTVSTAVSEPSCSVAQAVVVNEATGAIISACPEGIIVTENNVATVLLNRTYCAGYYSGLTMRGGYLFGYCSFLLIVYDAATYHELRLVDVDTLSCGNFESYYPDPSSNTIYLHCGSSGLVAFNMTTGLTHVLLPLKPYGTTYSIDKDAVSNSLYMTFALYGLSRYYLTDGHVTPIKTDCPVLTSVYVGEKGIVYANCHQNSLNNYILMINGSSIMPMPIGDDQCRSHANAQGYYPSTQTLLVSCYPTGGVFAVNVSTNVWTEVVSINQCPQIHDDIYFQDPKTLAVYVPCEQSGILVSSRDFKCQAGSMWSSGVCTACRPQTYRSHASLQPFGKCLPCSSGYAAPDVGSSSCTPCPAGTYESKKICYLCPSGKYQQSNASTTCVDCPLGQYAIHPGSTQCTLCSSGFYADTKGTVSCLPCTSGSASNITGLDRPCDGCLPGSYQPGVGQTSCFTCPAHSYAEQSNSTS